MYKLKVTAKAKKQFKEITKAYNQQAISFALQDIKLNPLLGKTLTRELVGRFSYKVGVYRIIYKINKKDKIVYILTVGHRPKVYK